MNEHIKMRQDNVSGRGGDSSEINRRRIPGCARTLNFVGQADNTVEPPNLETTLNEVGR